MNTLTDVQRGDINLDGSRDIGRQAVDFKLVTNELQGSTFHYALSFTNRLHRNHDGQGLLQIDRQEINVRGISTDRINLHILKDNNQAIKWAIALEGEQCVPASFGGNCLLKSFRIKTKVECLNAFSINYCRQQAVLTDLARATLTCANSRFYIQYRFGHLSIPPSLNFLI